MAIEQLNTDAVVVVLPKTDDPLLDELTLACAQALTEIGEAFITDRDADVLEFQNSYLAIVKGAYYAMKDMRKARIDAGCPVTAPPPPPEPKPKSTADLERFATLLERKAAECRMKAASIKAA